MKTEHRHSYRYFYVWLFATCLTVLTMTGCGKSPMPLNSKTVDMIQEKAAIELRKLLKQPNKMDDRLAVALAFRMAIQDLGYNPDTTVLYWLSPAFYEDWERELNKLKSYEETSKFTPSMAFPSIILGDGTTDQDFKTILSYYSSKVQQAAVKRRDEELANKQSVAKNAQTGSDSKSITDLIEQLGQSGKLAADAHVAIVMKGLQAVEPLCQRLLSLDPAFTSEREVKLMVGIVTTLGKISETNSQSMAQSVPAVLNLAMKTENRKAKTVLVCSLGTLFGPPAVPHVLVFIKTQTEAKSGSVPDAQTSIGLATMALVNMAEVKTGNAGAIVDAIATELPSSKGTFRKALCALIANFSQDSDKVVPILERELASEKDPDQRKSIENVLEIARANAGKR